MSIIKNAVENQQPENKAIKPQTGKKLKDYVEIMMPEIKRALPKVMTPERFMRITLSALSATPKLQECTPPSFLGAMMQAAQLGLEPNTPMGQAYLIPRNNRRRGTLECQFQIGYQGLIELFYRDPNAQSIDAQVVYQNDEFVYEYGLEPKLVHKPALSDRGEPIAYYGVWKLKNGGFGFKVMSIEDVRAHANSFSESFKGGYDSPWKSNFDGMAKKTVIKQALKYAPMSTDFVTASSADDTVKTSISDDMVSIPDESIIEAEYSVTDAETGEITVSDKQ